MDTFPTKCILLLACLNWKWTLATLFDNDYHYFSTDEDHSSHQLDGLNGLSCPPPFPDLLDIFKPSLESSPHLKNLTQELVKTLLHEDCETFSPLFNGHLSEFNSKLSSMDADNSPGLQTDQVLEDAIAATCPYPSNIEWGKRENEIEGDWKKKREGRKDDTDNHPSKLDGIYMEGEVGDSIGYKSIEGIYHKAGMSGDDDIYKGVYNTKGVIKNPTQDHMVSDIQKVGSVILIVVFVSVLVSVVVVVAVLAWLRKSSTRSFVDVPQNADDKSGGNHWYDATANKESYLMEQRGRNQVAKQYL